jgi:hypothetical protein
LNITPCDGDKERLRNELEKALGSGAGPKVARFMLALLGGVPLAGGAFGAGSAYWSETSQEKINQIVHAWMQLQQDEMEEIGRTMAEVLVSVALTAANIEKRVRSPEFLSLLKKCFREWSAAESETKRVLIRNLLSNAASCELCSDDVIRLFIQWIDLYSEAHFKVIKTIYKAQSISRYQIWLQIHGEKVREDSADADLFKLIIHDLSTGHVARQHRETDYYGNFVKPPPQRNVKTRSDVLKSAFDDEKPYELTELGKQFVHYTMNEIVPQLGPGSQTE